MRYATINPTTNECLKKYAQHRWRQVETMLRKAKHGFAINRTAQFSVRSKRLKVVATLLLERKEYYARLISLEMGKPLKEAIGEVEKCALVCNYYADNAKIFLQDQVIKTNHRSSIVSHAPLGIILAVMPWNFPFWQFFRFAAPALMAGNAIFMKHAPNVPQCALAIVQIFEKAQFPEGIVQNLFIDAKKVRWLIEDERVKAITFTGSDTVGAKIAEISGRNIKKTVLELGGSDPFIVLQDANLREAVKMAVVSRFRNAGQSCIAAKRFIVAESVADGFIQLLLEEIRQLKVGDPLHPDTDLGPLARADLLKNLERQVNDSLKLGAKLLIGGSRPVGSKGFFYNPTLLTKLDEDMPVYEEEVFGPVACVFTVPDAKAAVKMANDTAYGLGASIWTTDRERGIRLARQIEAGAVFINSLVRSSPSLPFGGVKRSGYGRELSEQGIKEFVNIKTLVVD
ncbi:MAG: NAD-dependent succinate-semialdehyde dehydrogenase [Chitinophagales bacterium]